MATPRATIPLKYQPRRYYCTDTVNSDCQKGFISAAGLNHHYNAVHKHHTTRPSRPQQHPWKPTGQHDGSGDDNIEPQGAYYPGTPVDLNGDDLPEGASPPKPNTPSKRAWHPFESRAHFELADFIFRQNEMPGAQIDELMHIWASMPGQAGTPPYANHEHLYSTIDAISEGDAPWTSFSMESVEAGGSGGPSWKCSGTYEVVFRDPQILLNHQLSNPGFKNHIDYSPRLVFGEKGQRVWSDLMTGNWAWNQCNELSKDPDNHGAMFVPIILGSDKTTVSVATGNNEYYPLYISAGNVHNGMRRAHGEAVSLLGFLSIPKTDKEFEADPEFCTFRRHLFHTSLEAIFHAMRPAMTKPQSIKCADGHYRRAIYGLGPYIADYPEQALLACIVQGWCPKCTAHRTHLDHDPNAILRNHEYTQLLMDSFASHVLWQKYGIVDDILPFTASFPHANIHELIAPDILHQIIKGTFKDHLVSWVETYLKKHYKNDFAAVLADIDRRIAVVPPFPGLRRFSQGCGFKQWTGNDSKALMKVYLPAIAGYVPNEMLQALSAFMDFCYIVRQSSLGEADLEALDKALQRFETHRSIFEAEGIHSDGISIPRIHVLQHYHEAIELFGAPNGLSTSIVESKHIHAEMAQVLLVNQRQDKLARFQAECLAEGRELTIDNLSLLNSLFSGLLDKPLIPQDNVHEDTSFPDDPYLQEAEDDGSERVDAVVQLAHKPFHLRCEKSFIFYIAPRKLRTLAEMGQGIGHPELPDLLSIFLFQQKNPGVDVPDISKCPKAIDRGYSFSSAVATFYAPSDFSGANGMHRQCIHASPSWRNGAPRYDCVFVEKDPTLPGFQGLYVAQVLLFFSFHYRNVLYPCALVQWFTPVGNEPCINTGMWKVEHEYDEYGDHLVSVIHLDSILRPAHLIGIYGDEYIPPDLHYSDSLAAFGSFYVNKYSDYHAFGLAF
ncbi:hypothetical protein EDD15DRAFT_2384735 [Pisolithus albus]|nr:hypothetical protein EDD15DRAFT_2384735 [Pisolithus albus]